MSILNALKGIGGQFEIQRVLGAAGTLTYIVMAPAFVWAGTVQASLEAFCLAYPAGLAACIGATAGAIALKDRSVATSTIIRETGAPPAAATPSGVQDVHVVNPPGDPANVQDRGAQ